MATGTRTYDEVEQGLMDRLPPAGTEEWLACTRALLDAARVALWMRVQLGGWRSPEQAKAGLGAHTNVAKALDILNGDLSQLEMEMPAGVP